MIITDGMVIAAIQSWLDFDGTNDISLEGRLRAALTAALATVPSDRKPDAWIGYWPGAGSIDSITRTTRWERTAEEWRSAGAEITPLYAHALQPQPSAPAGESGVKGLAAIVAAVMWEGSFERMGGEWAPDRVGMGADLCRAAGEEVVRRFTALQPQPSAPAGGEVAELIEAASKVYALWDAGTSRINFADMIALGKALANLKERSGE